MISLNESYMAELGFKHVTWVICSPACWPTVSASRVVRVSIMRPNMSPLPSIMRLAGAEVRILMYACSTVKYVKGVDTCK